MPSHRQGRRQPSDRYLAPRVIQTIGVLIVISSLTFWFVTGRQSSLFVGVGMTMVMLGGYEQTRREFMETIRSHRGRPGDTLEDEGTS